MQIRKVFDSYVEVASRCHLCRHTRTFYGTTFCETCATPRPHNDMKYFKIQNKLPDFANIYRPLRTKSEIRPPFCTISGSSAGVFMILLATQRGPFGELKKGAVSERKWRRGKESLRLLRCGDFSFWLRLFEAEPERVCADCAL